MQTWSGGSRGWPGKSTAWLPSSQWGRSPEVCLTNCKKILYTWSSSTSLVVSWLDVLLPVITHIINCSLTSEEFPDCWKEALVSPLLKKSGVLSEFTNLRPVSNLQYVSKLTERAVFDQTHAHLTSHGLYPPFQLALRKCHSTEKWHPHSCVTRFECCVWHIWPWSVVKSPQYELWS